VTDALAGAIKALAAGESLSAGATRDAFGVIMNGDATPAQIAALLVALRVKGETAAEIAGAAEALRRAMIRVEVPDPDTLVDTCGTGGGTLSTFNISTAAAFVAAGAGVRVAKHGNRSFTSRCGSADVLEALGVAISPPPEQLPAILARAGVMFMFAPAFHPAMRHVGPVRRELAIHTVMNVVGPLANPAGARRQVVGVSDPGRLRLLGESLARLGAIHALVVHGSPGLDELSPLGPSTVVEVRNGELTEWTLDPAEYGLSGGSPDDLAGGDPAENARTIERLLAGEAPPAARNAVVLNAAAAVYVGGAARDLAEAVGVATRALESGAPLHVLERLRSATSMAFPTA